MSALQFIGNLRTGTLAADNWRGTPLCMNQYRKLFGCTRVPHQEADEIVCYPESRHLVVMAKGRVYHFDAFWGDGTLCVSEGRLRENLELILDDARTATEACAVPGGILSYSRSSSSCAHYDHAHCDCAHYGCRYLVAAPARAECRRAYLREATSVA